MSIIDDFQCYQNWNEDGYKFEVVEEVKFEVGKWYTFEFTHKGPEFDTQIVEIPSTFKTQMTELPSGGLEHAGSDGSADPVVEGIANVKYNGKNWIRDGGINPCAEIELPRPVINAIKTYKPPFVNMDLRVAEKRAAREFQEEYQRKAYNELAKTWIGTGRT